MGWWLLRLSAKILALLRLSVNFFQLRLSKKLKINFFCFKKLNINLCGKAKADTQTPNSRPRRDIRYNRISVFTLETDYSCETGYPFDDSRQIGNTS